MYSGHVAGAVYAEVLVPRRVIVLCPNHTGFGPPLSIMMEGAWETPLGNVPIDAELAAALQARCGLLETDASAHRSEHGLEVQLPFLLERQPEVTFVPIVVGTGRFENLASLGEALAETIARHGDDILLLASSDMNHYESDVVTRRKDAVAIERLLAMDARGLFGAIAEHDISMCGFGPAVAILTAAGRLGAKKARFVRYATSGDASGDRSRVVGYAGIIFR